MIKEELELQYLDDQHSRAYHTGVIDGLGQALFAISPKEATTRAPISIVWFQEEEQVSPPKLQRLRERRRERSFEHMTSGLFETSEVD
jgi:hypothetical protein